MGRGTRFGQLFKKPETPDDRIQLVQVGGTSCRAARVTSLTASVLLSKAINGPKAAGFNHDVFGISACEDGMGENHIPRL